MNKTQKFLASAAALILLSGCVPAVGKPPAEITFDHIKPFSIYVAAFDVQEGYLGMGDNQNMGGTTFLTPPGQVVVDYFKSRYAAAGTNGKLVVNVESSSVTHKLVESENTMGAFLGVDHKDVYHLEVVSRLTAYDVGGFMQKEMKITAKRDLSISEHITLAERERAQAQALDQLLDDLDRAVQHALRNEFNILK